MSVMLRLMRNSARLLFAAPSMPSTALAERWSSAGRVAVLSLAGLGDCVMALPLMQAVKERKRNGMVHAFVPKACVGLVEASSLVDQVTGVDNTDHASYLNALREIRRFSPNVFLAAQPFNTLKHSLLAVAAGGKALRLKTERNYQGEEWRDFGFLYTRLSPDTAGRHRVEMNLDLLRVLGEDIPEQQYRPVMVVPDDERDAARELLPQTGRYVALHPGGLRPRKQWGAHRFAEACRLVANAYDVRFVMLGAGPDIAACREIIAALPELQWLDAAGTSTLPRTAALLERCDLLLSNDTGIMHLATAVGTPVAALFGPTDPRRIGPFHPDARYIVREPIQGISPEEAAEMVMEMLRHAPDGSVRSDQ